MAGVAVNVTLVPAHIAPDGTEEMVTLAAIEEFTDIVIVFDVAGLPVTPARLDVIIQVTVCPLVNENVVKVALFVPALVPFTCH